MANTEDNFSWTTVSEEEVDETKISFDMLGDTFIGTYLGQRQQDNDNGNYTQYRFRGGDDGVYFINSNYSLAKSMAKVRPNMLVRITYSGDKDTGQASPMRVFTVDIGKPAPKAPMPPRTPAENKPA